MKRAGAATLLVVLSFAACARLWGFDDLTTPDAGARADATTEDASNDEGSNDSGAMDATDAMQAADSIESSSVICDLEDAPLVPQPGFYFYENTNIGSGESASYSFSAGCDAQVVHPYPITASAHVMLLDGGCWQFDLVEIPFDSMQGHQLRYDFCRCDAGLCSMPRGTDRTEAQTWSARCLASDTYVTTFQCNNAVYMDRQFKSAVDAQAGQHECTGLFEDWGIPFGVTAPYVVIRGGELVGTVPFVTMHTREDQSGLDAGRETCAAGDANQFPITIDANTLVTDMWFDCTSGLPVRISRTISTSAALTTIGVTVGHLDESSDWLLLSSQPQPDDGGGLPMPVGSMRCN